MHFGGGKVLVDDVVGDEVRKQIYLYRYTHMWYRIYKYIYIYICICIYMEEGYHWEVP